MFAIEKPSAGMRTLVVVWSLGLALGACRRTMGEANAGPSADSVPARAKGEEGMRYAFSGLPGPTGAPVDLKQPQQGDPHGYNSVLPEHLPLSAYPVPLRALASSASGGWSNAGGVGRPSANLSGLQPPAAAEMAIAPAPARSPTHLDPNARYATTYRPGGAAFAAFEAAVSRGQIPGAYKELVGDFGARYAPALARPTDGALTIVADTERAAAAPSGGPLNLRVALVSNDKAASRSPLSVHIVLDVSGSMDGRPIEDAKHAAEAVVNKLDANDDFSMVTFSNDAKLLVVDGPIGPRRAQVLARIREVRAEGGTNLSAGLDLGYTQARAPAAQTDPVRVVMLLSDGHANAGDTSPDHLADRAASAFQEGIQTSAFGLGTDFDAGLMNLIADRGAGGYYYLADSSQIEPALAREVDARLNPVATAVEVRVRLRPDVSASKVFGSRELTAVETAQVRAREVAVDRQESRHGIAADRAQDADGGMRFFIPAFARADRHATIVTLDLPPGAGERSIASVEVKYKDRLLHKNVTCELPVRVRYAHDDAESAATANAGVMRMTQAFAAAETILAAAESVDHGNRAAARSLLMERADVLRHASESLAEPRLAEDATRLDRLASAVGGDQALGDPLALSVMLRGSGYGTF